MGKIDAAGQNCHKEEWLECGLVQGEADETLLKKHSSKWEQQLA